MKTTERFEKAVTKLYNAFHEGTLNAFACEACAVGNIVGHGNWAFQNVVDFSVYKAIYKEPVPNDSGYNVDELMKIEKIFLLNFPIEERCLFNGNGRDKNNQFKGLCAVVEYLCELDGIPNVMDYSSLFEYNENGAKNKLQTVFR